MAIGSAETAGNIKRQPFGSRNLRVSAKTTEGLSLGVSEEMRA